MSVAMGGQILLSADARQSLSASKPRLQSHGHWRLKGLDEPIELFEVGDNDAAFVPPPDADKAYRVVRSGDLWRPLREIRHNLPAEGDAFIGRGVELRHFAQRLDAGARLVTLLGPGGTGKTRFVLRYGSVWLGDWPGGVYFCDLSEARSMEGVQFAVASALGVPLAQGDPAVQIGHAIAGRDRCLVILDNFEQVLEHAPATLGRWLGRAARATFVVTSRERLRLPGEEVFPLEPLPLATEAIELFAARARAQRPEFELDASNRAAVADVVRLLDGLPLAIELAAARSRVLSPTQIVERLKDRFGLLAGARGAAARQATLRAAIDWSWDLLAPWEQGSLAQCSVFEGGFTLEAAEAVLDLRIWLEAPPAIDAVQSLVDKSLLRAWVPAEHSRYDIGEPYFGMYLSIHEYAAEKLERGGADTARGAQVRHGQHFAGFGSDERIEALSTEGGIKRRRALAVEIDNLVAACRRAIERRDAGIAAASYRAAWEVMVLQGPFGPGVALGAQVMALDGIDLPLRVQVAASRADALLRSGRLEEACTLMEQMLPQTQGVGWRRLEGLVLSKLGMLYLEQGRMDEARRILESALSAFEQVGSRVGQAGVLHKLGNLHDMQGSAEQSRSCHESALALYAESGDRARMGHVLGSLAILNRHLGRMEQAQAHYQSALAIHGEVGDRRSEGIVLGNLANVFMDQGHVEQAQSHLEAALAIHREVGSRVVEAFALANLAGVHEYHGRIELAREHFEQALVISREVGNRLHEGVVLGRLGVLEVSQGRTLQARGYLEQALAIARALGDRLSEATDLAALADLLTGEGQLAEAVENLRQAEAILRAIDNPFELANVLCVKARAELAAGHEDLAQATLAEAESIAVRIAARPDSELIREIAKVRQSLA
jgi:predicted ATPase